MTRVFLHYRETAQEGWTHEERHFSRLPSVGEYVAVSPQSPWHRVYAVVHCPFEADFEAEVFTDRDSTPAEAITARKPLPLVTDEYPCRLGRS